MSETVPVVRGDREAAADLALAMQMEATAYIVRKGKGSADQQPLTQAFARHRLEAIEEAARVAWRLMNRGGYPPEPNEIEDAIRALGRGEG